MEPADLFKTEPLSLALHRQVEAAIAEIGPVRMRVSKSQVGFYRRALFAATWRAGQYLHGRHAPLVLTIFLKRRDPSTRWKEVVEPAPGRFTHHVELYGLSDVDEFIQERLVEAWEQAA